MGLMATPGRTPMICPLCGKLFFVQNKRARLKKKNKSPHCAVCTRTTNTNLQKLYPNKKPKAIKAPCGAKIVKAKPHSRCSKYTECKQFSECLNLIIIKNWDGFNREKDV
jgi:hypothetical protein